MRIQNKVDVDPKEVVMLREVALATRYYGNPILWMSRRFLSLQFSLPCAYQNIFFVDNEREKLDILDISACMFYVTFSGAYLFGYAALAVWNVYLFNFIR